MAYEFAIPPICVETKVIMTLYDMNIDFEEEDIADTMLYRSWFHKDVVNPGNIKLKRVETKQSKLLRTNTTAISAENDRNKAVDGCNATEKLHVTSKGFNEKEVKNEKQSIRISRVCYSLLFLQEIKQMRTLCNVNLPKQTRPAQHHAGLLLQIHHHHQKQLIRAAATAAATTAAIQNQKQLIRAAATTAATKATIKPRVPIADLAR